MMYTLEIRELVENNIDMINKIKREVVESIRKMRK